MSDNDESRAADGPRVERVLSLVPEPAGLRVLDLACRTGWFASALASRGAHVLGVEGRQSNADLIPAGPNLTVKVGDVRDLLALVGEDGFDVSLCLGILYHLAPGEVLGLLQDLCAVTSGYAVIDTNTCAWHERGPGHPQAAGDRVGVTVGCKEYEGCWFSEGDCAHPWAAIGNRDSFWFTRESLLALVHRAGFRHVLQVPGKGHPLEPDERLWFVAVP